jgi:hypothetical protein
MNLVIGILVILIIMMLWSCTVSSDKWTTNYYNFSDELSGPELENYTNNRPNTGTCQRPTSDNPFMNPLTTEYNTRPVKYCSPSDLMIEKEIDTKFKTNLYTNFSDIYNTLNSQRNWYTVPTPSIPPDNTELNKWLYKTGPTCKEDSRQCLRYVDIRADRLYTPNI